LLSGELLVEIGSIGSALDSWEVRRWNPLMVNIIEVDIFEEEMSLDIFSVGLARTQSSCRVSSEELNGQ